MSELVELLTGGNGLSSSTVSRITKRLEEGVEQLRSREMGEFPFVYLDATYYKIRWARKVESFPLLIAYGVNAEGKRELLAVEAGTEESEASWGGLLGRLRERGLRGVQLGIPDDH